MHEGAFLLKKALCNVIISLNNKQRLVLMSEYKSLNAIAYDHLRELIYNRELEFNTIYSETKLAANLSISRTPMRDALNRLAQERYIDILPSRGFVLHKPTAQDITEGYHVRRMIELYCAEAVARNYPNEKSRTAIAAMEDALNRQRSLLENMDAYSLNQFWFNDLDFHKAPLYYLNLPSFMKQLDTFMHFFMPHHMMDEAVITQEYDKVMDRHLSTLTEHAQIIEALKSGDLDRVRETVCRHLRTSFLAQPGHEEIIE